MAKVFRAEVFCFTICLLLGMGISVKESVHEKPDLPQSIRSGSIPAGHSTPNPAKSFADLILKQLEKNKDTYISLINVLQNLVDPNVLSNQAFLTVLNRAAELVFGVLPTKLQKDTVNGTILSLLHEIAQVNLTQVNTSDITSVFVQITRQLSFSNVLSTYYTYFRESDKFKSSFQTNLDSLLLNMTFIKLPNLLRNPVIEDIASLIIGHIKSLNFTDFPRNHFNINNLKSFIQTVYAQFPWTETKDSISEIFRKYNVFPNAASFPSAVSSILLDFVFSTIPDLVKRDATWSLVDLLYTEVKTLDLSVIDPKDIPASIKLIIQQIDVWGLIDQVSSSIGWPNSTKPDIHPSCASDVRFSLEGLISAQPWALAMVDALGKPGTGLLKGNLYQLGNYDECISTSALEKIKTLHGYEEKERFTGKFCRVSINLPMSLIHQLTEDTHGLPIRLSWGICVPNTCSEKDLTSGLTKGYMSRFRLNVEEVFCGERAGMDLKDNTRAAAAIGILVGLVSLVLVGTLVEIVATRTNKDQCTDSSLHLRNQDKEKSKPSMGIPGAVSRDVGDTDISGYGPSGNDSMFVQTWACFSVLSTIPRVLSARHTEESITCLHGIRYLSMTWVILCNTFYIGLFSISDSSTVANMLDATSYLKTFTFLPILYGTFAVDTFFLLSGFLVAYRVFQRLEKHKRNITFWQIAGFYGHRLWRLTPLYMIVLMGFSCLYQYLATGPLFPRVIQDAENCKVNWWTNLLYVNNLVSEDKMCMAWSWYLSNDMQFYLISPLFILPLYFFPSLGIILTGLLVATGITSTSIIEHRGAGDILSKSLPQVPGKPSYYDDIFIKPWCRVSAYAIGMLLAKLLHHRGRKTIHPIFTLIGWVIALAIGIFLVYIGYTEKQEGSVPWSIDVQSVYEGLSRPAFAASVAWVIFACHSGNGGAINSILSFKGFIPMARLTYAAFLVHPILIVICTYTSKSLLYLDNYSMAYLFIGHTCLSYLAAFVLCVLFESPYRGLENTVSRMFSVTRL